MIFRDGYGNYVGAMQGSPSGFEIELYDEETGKFENRAMKWATVNGVKVIKGVDK